MCKQKLFIASILIIFYFYILNTHAAAEVNPQRIKLPDFEEIEEAILNLLADTNNSIIFDWLQDVQIALDNNLHSQTQQKNSNMPVQ